MGGEVVQSRNVRFWKAIVDAELLANKNRHIKVVTSAEKKNVLSSKCGFDVTEEPNSAGYVKPPKAMLVDRGFLPID